MEYKIVNNIFEKILGLRFKYNKDLALIYCFKKPVKHKIDNFFVSERTLIVLFDENLEITEECVLNPNKIFTPQVKYKYFIEFYYNYNNFLQYNEDYNKIKEMMKNE